MRKIWYIYTMEYYTAEKSNDVLKFAEKQMDLENIIVSEVTAVQKDKYMYSLKSGFQTYGKVKLAYNLQSQRA